MNDALYDIRAADPADAVPLSALAHRAKASWGYPSEWLVEWSEELTLTPEYLQAYEGFVATSERRDRRCLHAGSRWRPGGAHARLDRAGASSPRHRTAARRLRARSRASQGRRLGPHRLRSICGTVLSAARRTARGRCRRADAWRRRPRFAAPRVGVVTDGAPRPASPSRVPHPASRVNPSISRFRATFP